MKPLIYLRDDSTFTIPRGLYALLGQFGPSGRRAGRLPDRSSPRSCSRPLPMIVIFFLAQRYFIEGIATQGRKG